MLAGGHHAMPCSLPNTRPVARCDTLARNDRIGPEPRPMKITRLETFLTNAGLRNYLFVRLTTDTGLTGLGEASLEWQEMTVQTLLHEWALDRVLGADPFDVERLIGGLIRDQ